MAKRSRMKTTRGMAFIARIKENLSNLAPYVSNGKEMLRHIRTYRAYRQAAQYWGKQAALEFVSGEIRRNYFKTA